MIEKIVLKNFKIHKESEIVFGETLSILTGENNSGKTSLLESLLIWYECFQHTLHIKSGDLQIGEFDFQSQFISHFSSMRSANYWELFHNNNNHFEIQATLLFNDKRIDVGFFVSKARNETAYNISPKVSATNLVLLNRFDPKRLIALFKSSPVSSIIRNEEYLHPKKLAKLIAENESNLTMRNRLLRIKQQNPQKLVDLKEQLKFIMGFDFFDLKIDFDLEQDLFVSALFRTTSTAKFQDIAMLGSGTLQMLEVLIALNWEQHSLIRIVLLDEPDAYLHRKLHGELLNRLRSFSTNKVQIICTTHNEQIIAQSNLKEVLHLANPSKPMKVKPLSADLPAGRKIGILQSESKQNLYHTLGISASAMNILEAIESEQLVLVEGRSDRVYIEALQAKRRSLFPVPQEKKVAFWSINGISDLPNKLSYWKDILNNIRNEKSLWEKSILLLDRDALSNEEKNALSKSLSERYGINTIFWNAYTIESILLENLTGFCRSLAKQFGCETEKIQQLIMQSKFSEVEFFEHKKIRFERQREGRQKEFEVLNQNTLKSLSAHNKHERFLKGLRQQENQFYLFFNKDDVFELLQYIYTEFAEKENIFLADEQRLLGVINHIDGDFWQDSWTHILQKVYG